MKKKFLSFFICLTFISCGKEITPEQVTACDGSSSENCECFKATNKERVNNNLPAFAYCKSCYNMAQDQAEDMVKYNYFSHDRLAINGREAESFAQRVGRFGLSGGAGENIAGTTGASAVVMWMASPAHKANILYPSFRSFSCGTKNNLSVQVFSVYPE